MSNDNQQIIDLLTEIRDLLRGGAAVTQAHGATAVTQSFTAESLSATVDDGKVYWKVRGGMFKKFGVTVWPETLAAAGFDADLSPLKSHDLTGYTAVYVLNEEGKAQKVIQLIPPTAVTPEPPPASQPTTKQNGRTATPKPVGGNGKPVPGQPTEPSWFRPGDKVQATDQNGKQHTGVITGTVGSDQKIAVKIGKKIYRLDLDKVEMLEPTF